MSTNINAQTAAGAPSGVVYLKVGGVLSPAFVGDLEGDFLSFVQFVQAGKPHVLEVDQNIYMIVAILLDIAKSSQMVEPSDGTVDHFQAFYIRVLPAINHCCGPNNSDALKERLQAAADSQVKTIKSRIFLFYAFKV